MVKKKVDVMTTPSNDWGVVQFNDVEATMIKKADYSALIKSAKVIIKPEYIWLIVDFEIIEHEVFAGFMPDPYFLLIGSRDSTEQRKVREGRTKYLQLGNLTKTPLNDRPVDVAAPELVSKKVRIAVTKNGSGLAVKNPVQKVFSYDGPSYVS
jgi:hypothetical protein